MIKIWIDIVNSHEPAFFKPFLREFANYDIFVTSRQYAEVVPLLNKLNIKHEVISRWYDGNMIKRTVGYLIRDLQLFVKVPAFDVSLHHVSLYCLQTTKVRFRTTIMFTDNDLCILVNKLSFKYLNYLITPIAIPLNILIEQGARKGNIFQYNGFKEDVYVADFKADPKFLDNLPFNDFITIRPESLQASYVPKGIKSIVPDLMKAFDKENINMLFLPRYRGDREYARNLDAFIPSEPLNGLDVCYYSKAILTGAGTFAREAACIGTPAIQFFPGTPASVDKKLIEEGKMFNSRDVNEIVDYVLSAKKRKLDLRRSKKVQREVFDIVKGILEEIEMRKH